MNCCVLKWIWWRRRLLLNCGSWCLCLCLSRNSVLECCHWRRRSRRWNSSCVGGRVWRLWASCFRELWYGSIYCFDVRCCRRGVIGVDERWFDYWYQWSSVGDETCFLCVDFGSKADAYEIPNRCRAHDWFIHFHVRPVIVREMTVRCVWASMCVGVTILGFSEFP